MGIHEARREMKLREALRLATAPRNQIQNYSVWQDDYEIESQLSRDEAVGFARGLVHVGLTYNGSMYNPVVRCGDFICWPEDRYGELVGETEGDSDANS